MLKKLNKNIIVLSWVSFFTDISSEMLYPILPIFLTSVLKAPMTVVGLIEGTAEATASILKGISGWFSDRVSQKKPFVVYGYSLSAISRLILTFSFQWPLVLVARFLDRLGKGIRTSPRDSLIAGLTTKENRGLAFGFHRAMDTFGALLGPLFTLLLLYLLSTAGAKEQYRTIFAISFIPVAIAVLLLIFFIKEKAKDIDKTKKIRFNIRDLRSPFGVFLLISSVFAIGNSSDVFLIMRMKHFEFSTAMVILAYTLYNLTYSLLSTPAGIISDRIGRRKVISFGFLIFSLVYLGFAFIDKGYQVWILFAVYGFYIAMTEGVGKAFIADVVNEDLIGTALGAYYMAMGLLNFLASFIAGLLWTYIDIRMPFLFGAVMSFIAFVLFLLCIKKG